jgi:hypothetical protein
MSDYVEIARRSHAFKDEHIEERAKENLALLGGVYSNEQHKPTT